MRANMEYMLILMPRGAKAGKPIGVHKMLASPMILQHLIQKLNGKKRLILVGIVMGLILTRRSGRIVIENAQRMKKEVIGNVQHVRDVLELIRDYLFNEPVLIYGTGVFLKMVGMNMIHELAGNMFEEILFQHNFRNAPIKPQSSFLQLFRKFAGLQILDSILGVVIKNASQKLYKNFIETHEQLERSDKLGLIVGDIFQSSLEFLLSLCIVSIRLYMLMGTSAILGSFGFIALVNLILFLLRPNFHQIQQNVSCCQKMIQDIQSWSRDDESDLSECQRHDVRKVEEITKRIVEFRNETIHQGFFYNLYRIFCTEHCVHLVVGFLGAYNTFFGSLKDDNVFKRSSKLRYFSGLMGMQIHACNQLTKIPSLLREASFYLREPHTESIKEDGVTSKQSESLLSEIE